MYTGGFGAALVAALLVAGNALDQNPFYNVTETWQGRFQAEFCVTAPQDLYGWNIKIRFDDAVSGGLMIPGVLVVSTNIPSYTTYRIRDMGWNARILAGERICHTLIGMDPGLRKAPNAVVEFFGLPEEVVCDDQTQGQQYQRNVTDHWQTGMKGAICLRVPRDFSGDWNIRMELSKKMKITCPDAEAENMHKRLVWNLTPRSYNQDLSEGQMFCLDFEAETLTWVNPCIKAFFTEADGVTPIEVDLPSTGDPAPTSPAPSAAPTAPAPSAVPTTPAPTAAPTTLAPSAAPTTAAPTAAPTTPAPTAAPTSDLPMTQTPTSVAPGLTGNINQGILDYYTNTYHGNGTYYGDTKEGTCSYDVNNMPPVSEMSQIAALVALNYILFDDSRACGMCFKVSEMLGEYIVFVKDLCPAGSCNANGDVSFALNGDGRWYTQIQAVQCPVGNTKLQYSFQGSNPGYIKLQIRNFRIPPNEVSIQKNGVWTSMTKSADGYWISQASEMTNLYDIPVRITAINGEMLEDIIPSLVNDQVLDGLLGVQFSHDASLPS